MAICPKCKKEISTLSYNSMVAVTQIFSVEDEKCDYSAMDDYGNHTDEKYKCPECYETLFTENEDAEKFLR